MENRGSRLLHLALSFAKSAVLQMGILVDRAHAAIARAHRPGVDLHAGRRRRIGVFMRMLGAVLVVFVAAHPAAAQTDKSAPSAATTRSATQTGKFRRPGIRPPTLRAR